MSEYGSIRTNVPVKIVTLAVVVLAFMLAWTTLNRALGVMVGANATSKEIAEIGTGLAPENAWTHFASGVLLERTFLPEDLVRSQQEFEKAVTLSPDDYRLWLGLAGSYEKNGNSDKAESAFRKALELAPNYTQVQWRVGNFLLRREKNEEAFELIRSAASKDSSLASSASAVAWNLYDGDLALIKRYFGDSLSLKGGLAVFLAGQGKLDEAMDVWATIPKEAMTDKLSPLGDSVMQKLADAHRYLLILRLQELKGVAAPKPGQVSNGDFEGPILLSNGGVFDWQFTDAPNIQVGVDPSQMRDGFKQTALAMVFKSDGRSFSQVSQKVPVNASKYLFSVKYKSNLEYRSTMKWEIVSAVDSKLLASTDPIAEKSDWATLKTEVVIPEKTEGVVIRLVRTGCDSIICPLLGKVWFDDVVLEEISK